MGIGSLPERRVTGRVAAVDLRKRDAEVKLLLGCTTDEMETITALQRSGDQAALLIEREG